MTNDLIIPLKVVLAGDGAVGKTMLLYSYKNKSFEHDYVPHVFDQYSVTLGLNADTKVNLELHDTAGQEDFIDIRGLTLMDSSTIILCYACDSIVSLDNIPTKWVPEIESLSLKGKKPTPAFVLVGTKSDLFNKGDPEHVPKKKAITVSKQIKAASHVRCSALAYGEGNGDERNGKVEEVFRKAVRAGIEASEYKSQVFRPEPCCFLC